MAAKRDGEGLQKLTAKSCFENNFSWEKCIYTEILFKVI